MSVANREAGIQKAERGLDLFGYSYLLRGSIFGFRILTLLVFYLAQPLGLHPDIKLVKHAAFVQVRAVAWLRPFKVQDAQSGLLKLQSHFPPGLATATRRPPERQESPVRLVGLGVVQRP